MELSLALATALVALVFLLAGAGLLWRAGDARALLRGFPRSMRAAYATMGLGSAWTLYLVSQLGEADFGRYKGLIFAAFLAIALLSFKYARDFLSVRGACILYLLCAQALLSAAFMRYDEPARLFMVAPVYAGVALSLYLAYAPFRARDFISWLFGRSGRPRVLGTVLLAYGALLGAVAVSF